MPNNNLQNSNLESNVVDDFNYLDDQNPQNTKIPEIEETEQDALEVINQIENSKIQPDTLIGYSFEELTKLNLELEKELGLTMPPIVEGRAIRVLTETIPYWKSLYRILKEAYLGKLLPKESVVKIVTAFSKVPDVQKPNEIEKYQKILDEELALSDTLKSIIIREQIRKDIFNSISDYPIEFQKEFVDLFIKGEVPDQNFYDRLKKAMESKDIQYRDPRDIIESIRKELKTGAPKYNQTYSPNQISDLIENETEDDTDEEPLEFTYSDDIIQKQNQERQEMLARLKKRQQLNQTETELVLNSTNLPQQNLQYNNQPPYPSTLNPTANQTKISQPYPQTYPVNITNQNTTKINSNQQNNQTQAKKDALIQSLIRKGNTSPQPSGVQINKHATKNLDDLLGNKG